MAVTVLKSGNSLYVWTAGFGSGYSKVWRLKVNTPPSPTESGVVDFLGERLIPSSTPATIAAFLAAYNAPSVLLRSGGEESPPVYMAESGGALGYLGGNHRVGGFDTIAAYGLEIKLDGAAPPENVLRPCQELVVTERYGINTGTALAFPMIASVKQEWKWDGSNFCRFEHRITAEKPIDLGWWGGAQFQKLNVGSGRTLHLYVPGSSAYGPSIDGVDITGTTSVVEIGAADWIDPSRPPSRFETFVKDGGVTKYTLILSYDEGSYRGDMGMALTRSAASKIYPHGVDFDPPREMRPGESFSVSGYFGTYEGR